MGGSEQWHIGISAEIFTSCAKSAAGRRAIWRASWTKRLRQSAATRQTAKRSRRYHHCHVGAVRRVHRRADLWRERGSSFDKTLGGGAKARCCGLIAGVDAVQRRQRQGRACTDTIAFASHKGNGAVKKQASKFLSRAVRGCVRPCFFGQNSSFAAWNP